MRRPFENLGRVARTGSLFFLALSLFVLGLPVAGSSQELAATLTGTVTDASGAVVPGATVLVHNDETNTDIRTATTSSTGGFNITNIPAGRYTVTVRNEGFQTYAASSVVLNVAEKHERSPLCMASAARSM
jgi:predicted phage tail protein